MNVIADHRKSEYKKTVSATDGRRRRADTTLKIRKERKEKQLKKKREYCSGFENQSITQHERLDTIRPTITDIPRLKALLSSRNASEQDRVDATRGFRRMLSVEKNIPARELIDDGIIPLLVQNLSPSSVNPTSASLIFESSWALTNIASTNCTMDVVNAGAIKPLVGLLLHRDANVREQAIWCLGNIAGEGPDFRDQVLQESAIDSLLENLNKPYNMSLLENVVWTISNLCRGTPPPAASTTGSIAYPLVSYLDKPISEGATVDMLWALSYLSNGDDKRIESVIATGVTNKLVCLLKDKKMKIKCKIPIVRILGNFVSGTESQTQTVIESGVLDILASLLGSSSKMIRKESSWLASNVACGNHRQITELMGRQKVLKQIIINSTEDLWDVRKESVWTLSNICTSGNDMHVKSLVESGGVEPLVMLLALENADTTLLISTIDALRRILTVGELHEDADYKQQIAEYNGIEHLEELQSHPSATVYKKVVRIIEDYFGIENEEDENLAPMTSESGTFGFGLASPKQLFTNNFSAESISESNSPAFPFGNLSTNTFYPV